MELAIRQSLRSLIYFIALAEYMKEIEKSRSILLAAAFDYYLIYRRSLLLASHLCPLARPRTGHLSHPLRATLTSATPGIHLLATAAGPAISAITTGTAATVTANRNCDCSKDRRKDDKYCKYDGKHGYRDGKHAHDRDKDNHDVTIAATITVTATVSVPALQKANLTEADRSDAVPTSSRSSGLSTKAEIAYVVLGSSTTCRKCNKILNSRQEIRAHVKTCKGTGPLRCPDTTTTCLGGCQGVDQYPHTT
ncbi:hypothetical protein VTK56DRAFT_4697 [Thermocarpiscus australiensis]